MGIQKMISDVDDDGSGTIEYEEFLKMMTHKILNRDPKDEILKAFRLFDDDETGKISFKNLKRVAKELGERMTDEELQEMIDEADRDGDGEVNEEEFLRIMKKTNLFYNLVRSAQDKTCLDRKLWTSGHSWVQLTGRSTYGLFGALSERFWDADQICKLARLSEIAVHPAVQPEG